MVGSGLCEGSPLEIYPEVPLVQVLGCRRPSTKLSRDTAPSISHQLPSDPLSPQLPLDLAPNHQKPQDQAPHTSEQELDPRPPGPSSQRPWFPTPPTGRQASAPAPQAPPTSETALASGPASQSHGQAQVRLPSSLWNRTTH